MPRSMRAKTALWEHPLQLRSNMYPVKLNMCAHVSLYNPVIACYQCTLKKFLHPTNTGVDKSGFMAVAMQVINIYLLFPYEQL